MSLSARADFAGSAEYVQGDGVALRGAPKRLALCFYGDQMY